MAAVTWYIGLTERSAWESEEVSAWYARPEISRSGWCAYLSVGCSTYNSRTVTYGISDEAMTVWRAGYIVVADIGAEWNRDRYGIRVRVTVSACQVFRDDSRAWRCVAWLTCVVLAAAWRGDQGGWLTDISEHLIAVAWSVMVFTADSGWFSVALVIIAGFGAYESVATD